MKNQLALVDSNSSTVHPTAEEFENEDFTLKSHQMSSVHITAEEFENATIARHFAIDYV